MPEINERFFYLVLGDSHNANQSIAVSSGSSTRPFLNLIPDCNNTPYETTILYRVGHSKSQKIQESSDGIHAELLKSAEDAFVGSGT